MAALLLRSPLPAGKLLDAEATLPVVGAQPFKHCLQLGAHASHPANARGHAAARHTGRRRKAEAAHSAPTKFCTSTPKLLPSETEGAFIASHCSALRNSSTAKAAWWRTRLHSLLTSGLRPGFAFSGIGCAANLACTSSSVIGGKLALICCERAFAFSMKAAIDRSPLATASSMADMWALLRGARGGSGGRWGEERCVRTRAWRRFGDGCRP